MVCRALRLDEIETEILIAGRFVTILCINLSFQNEQLTVIFPAI